MKRRVSTPSISSHTPTARPAAEAPTLPPWKAFVVQFSRETRAGSTVFSGRVEHLNSGRRTRFESPQDLLTALEQLLGEIREDQP